MYAEKQLGISPKLVYLAGDSAGGNITVAVTLKCIQNNFRIPDGILLGYPAMSLSLKRFTPSLLTALDDFILRYSFLSICIDSYVKDGNAD